MRSYGNIRVGVLFRIKGIRAAGRPAALHELGRPAEDRYQLLRSEDRYRADARQYDDDPHEEDLAEGHTLYALVHYTLS